MSQGVQGRPWEIGTETGCRREDERTAGKSRVRLRARQIVKHFPGTAERLGLGPSRGIEVQLRFQSTGGLGIQLPIQVSDQLFPLLLIEMWKFRHVNLTKWPAYPSSYSSGGFGIGSPSM
jgi:hypothetical protein